MIYIKIKHKIKNDLNETNLKYNIDQIIEIFCCFLIIWDKITNQFIIRLKIRLDDENYRFGSEWVYISISIEIEIYN